MIDMNCPSCGAGGRIPREKVNTRLVCKKCLQGLSRHSRRQDRAGRTGRAQGRNPSQRHAASRQTRYGRTIRRGGGSTLEGSSYPRFRR